MIEQTAAGLGFCSLGLLAARAAARNLFDPRTVARAELSNSGGFKHLGLERHLGLEELEMLRLFPRLMLVVGIGMTGMACQDNGYAAGGYSNPAPTGPVYNGYSQPAPNYNYANQQGSHGSYNQADGRRYTTVNVTNRGQNGNRDDVVQQQVVCGSQYSDGYRTRTAPRC